MDVEKTTILRAIAMSCGIYIWEISERPRYNYNQYEDSLSHLIKAEWKDEVVTGSFFDARNFEYFTKLLDEWQLLIRRQLNYFWRKIAGCPVSRAILNVLLSFTI